MYDGMTRARRPQHVVLWAGLLSGLIAIPATTMAYSDGPATIGAVDGTGSPRSGGSCAQCHGRETTATTTQVQLFDAQGAEVTSLQGGDAYIVELRVDHDDFGLFGGQLSALTVQGNLSTGFFVRKQDAIATWFDEDLKAALRAQV